MNNKEQAPSRSQRKGHENRRLRQQTLTFTARNATNLSNQQHPPTPPPETNPNQYFPSQRHSKKQPGPSEEALNTPFRNILGQKALDHIRIIMSNINGLYPKDLEHVQFIKEWLRWTEANIAGLIENNAHWGNLGKEYHPREHFRTKKAMRYQYSYNKHDKGKSWGSCTNQTFQQGGTMTMAFDVATSRMVNKGQDPTGLSRWSWLLFQGKHGIRTRIITAYQPVSSGHQDLMAVYAQQ